jgi:2-methylcitrate dehydratase PrpD
VDHPRGHARNPLSVAELEAKFIGLAHPVLGRDRSDAVLRWVWELERAGSIQELMRMIEVRQ